MPRLILASGSPRRRTLLVGAGFDINAVIPPQIPEVRRDGEAPIDYVRRLAREKSAAVPGTNTWVIAADTIVHKADTIFEKPKDDPGAAIMLGTLAGDWHRVTTAWNLRWSGPSPAPNGRTVYKGHSTSRVKFRGLTPIEIARYVVTGEGRDKAGGYAVQGLGAGLIDRVVGSTTNVVGLPLDKVVPAMLAAGLTRSKT
jgi:septum formation protein